MQLEYTAPDHVRDAVQEVGRTEDVKFSPSGHRLAVAGFDMNQIAIFDVCLPPSPGGQLAINDVAFISSPHLEQPHGIDFINDDRLIVANRLGNVTTFECPTDGGGRRYELEPIGVIRSGEVMSSPGSVSVTPKGDNLYEALVCNNRTDRVTSHLIDSHGNSKKDAVLLEKWLRWPDGIDVFGNWVAISNNSYPYVLICDRTGSMNEEPYPDGLLRFCRIPHGVRFAHDGRFILVADYDGPFIHIYVGGSIGDELDWRGLRNPITSLRVMSDEVFFGGPSHGRGPKGLDIGPSSNIVAVACTMQPLAFFDLTATFRDISFSREIAAGPNEIDHEFQSDKITSLIYEIETMKGLFSWRITAPLRWVRGLF